MKTAPRAIPTVPGTPVRFFFYVTKPFAGWAVSAILVVIIAAAVGQSLPLFYKWIIEAVQRHDLQSALYLGLLYPIVVFSESFLWRITGILGMKWTVHVKKYSNDELVKYTLQHSHDFFSNRFAGSLLNKIGNVTGGVESFINDFLWSILGLVVSVIVTIYFLFKVDSTSAWLFVMLIVLLLGLNSLLAKHKRFLSLTQAGHGSRMRGFMSDLLTNTSIVRQHTSYKDEERKMQELSSEWRSSHEVSWRFSEFTQLGNGFIICVFFTSMMYVLIGDWESGLLSVADFIFILALITALTGKLTFIGRVMTNLARVMGEVEEGLSELIVPLDITDAPGASALKVSTASVVLADMGFMYNQMPVFKDFSLTIASGQRLGVVGHSGAGKSTLVSLLLRQHDVASGAIKIDGQDIREVTQSSLRQAIAVVPQEPALFHRSIRDNILYGKPDATTTETEQVARLAAAHDFIMSLPEGYDTLVGERGVKLSGGQKQRIAIARAMLKNAPILILDEATSALDSESEVEIQKALHVLMTGKTVIAIAHRLSTLREMDRIVVLDQGHIVEDGTHDSLRAYGGVYARLWEHQAGGFLLE